MHGKLARELKELWLTSTVRGNIHGPPIIRKLSRRISIRLTAWQNLVVTLLGLYVARNFGKLLGLECPEPLANLYSRAYFRATWVTTALDAGFWTAMRIRRKWLRDLASIVFSVYYLIAAEQADEKVRKVRGLLTVDHLRVSWNKPTTPYISFLTKLLRPRLTRYPPRAIRIPRPPDSSYTEPISGWLYFDGPLSALKKHTRVIMDVPGGGYVAMSPRHHDDKLLGWAGRTGLPILSLEYKKAPEHPYPYALNECYDAYRTLVASRGRCVGLSGECQPKIVISGDSAGANLATGLVLMVLQASSGDALGWSNELSIPPPDGMVLIYPGLDMNIGNWMTEEQMCLIKDRRTRDINKNVLRRKSEDYSQLTPATPHRSDDEEDDKDSPPSDQAPVTQPLSASPISTSPDPAAGHNSAIGTPLTKTTSFQPQALKTRLAMSSMISYFNDRILTPEMMRAMIILYVGPHNRPDFATDYLLSPLLAPESLLARFPKVYFLTGERDPLVDDTVIFAGRLRQAKASAWLERKELGLLQPSEREFNERDHVEVNLITGVSHGFLQFVSIFPEGWKYIFRCADWMEDIFAAADAFDSTTAPTTPAATPWTPGGTRSQTPNGTRAEGERQRHHRHVRTESSGDEDRPLEMSMLSSSSNKGASNGDAHSHKHHHDHAHTDRGKGSRHRGQPRKSAMRKRQDSDIKRSQSSVSLASEDDLLGRRMKGLAGGLMGDGTGELS